jgi:L-threonylcarbamoyladenylate synthase
MAKQKSASWRKNIEKNIVPILLSGGIGVFPTDTIYGVIGSALKKETVERIYKLRKRELKKPMIILISSTNDLHMFGIDLNAKQKSVIAKLWPGKISIIFDCKSKKMSYLHRGTKTLALRLPACRRGRSKDENLVKILKKTGPLVAPSANLAGKKSAQTVGEAKKYFGEKVDFYVDCGKLKSMYSTLVKLDKNGEVKILRQGAVKINP